MIRFDQIGHGLTGPAPDGDYSTAALRPHGRCTWSRKLGVERFVLAGNSMGGGIALDYALAHPEQARRAGAGRCRRRAPDGQAERQHRLLARPQSAAAASCSSAITPRALIERSLQQSVTNQAVATPAAVDRYWELLRYPGNRAATFARFSQPRASLSREQLAGMKVPTLILWGEQDGLIPVAAGRWFHAALPDRS